MLLLVSLFHRFLHFLLQTKTICFNSSPQIRVLFLEYLYSNNLTLGLFSKPMEIISIFSLVIVFHLNTSIPPPGITTLLLNFLCLEICYYFPIFSFSTLFYFLGNFQTMRIHVCTISKIKTRKLDKSPHSYLWNK